MIKAKNIKKSFGSLQVLKGINLEIPKGEIHSIVGASGAGKTTLLQILGTLSKPDSGEIHYNGKNVSSFSEKELAVFRNKEIGFVFQFHHLLPEFTALENVCIPAFIAGMPKKKAVAKATQLLRELNLAERLDHKPSELSGGERQRAAIARALINYPKCVLADEPTGNLDSKTAEQIYQLMLELNQEMGVSFLVVTHDPDLANRIDNVLHMEDGLII